jgi:hypothetical protein
LTRTAQIRPVIRRANLHWAAFSSNTTAATHAAFTITKRNTMNQPINDDSHLWVSWDDYHGLIERLALVVQDPVSGAWRLACG